METKFLFPRIARAFLVLVVMGNGLIIPSQNAFAKASAVFTNCASQMEIPQAECAALVAFYTNTNGASWTDHTDWLETDTPCSWYGVSCESGTNVTKLELETNNLS